LALLASAGVIESIGQDMVFNNLEEMLEAFKRAIPGGSQQAREK
jgi:hypothetical protein